MPLLFKIQKFNEECKELDLIECLFNLAQGKITDKNIELIMQKINNQQNLELK